MRTLLLQIQISSSIPRRSISASSITLELEGRQLTSGSSNMSKPQENFIGAVQWSNSFDGNKYGKPEAVAWELRTVPTVQLIRSIRLSWALEYNSHSYFPNPLKANT